MFLILPVPTSRVLGRMQHIKHHDSTLALWKECKVTCFGDKFCWSNSVLKCFLKLLYLQNQKTKKQVSTMDSLFLTSRDLF